MISHRISRHNSRHNSRRVASLPVVSAFSLGACSKASADADYQPPFPLTATLNKLTVKVDRPTLSPEDIKKLEAAAAAAADAGH